MGVPSVDLHEQRRTVHRTPVELEDARCPALCRLEPGNRHAEFVEGGRDVADAAASAHATTALIPTCLGRERIATTRGTSAQRERASKKNRQTGSRKPGKARRNVASALSNWPGGYATMRSPRPTRAAVAMIASVVRLAFGPSWGEE